MKHHAVITKHNGGGYEVTVYSNAVVNIWGDLGVAASSFTFTLRGARRWARRTIAQFDEEHGTFREVVGLDPKPLNLGLTKATRG